MAPARVVRQAAGHRRGEGGEALHEARVLLGVRGIGDRFDIVDAGFVRKAGRPESDGFLDVRFGHQQRGAHSLRGDLLVVVGRFVGQHLVIHLRGVRLARPVELRPVDQEMQHVGERDLVARRQFHAGHLAEERLGLGIVRHVIGRRRDGDLAVFGRHQVVVARAGHHAGVLGELGRQLRQDLGPAGVDDRVLEVGVVHDRDLDVVRSVCGIGEARQKRLCLPSQAKESRTLHVRWSPGYVGLEPRLKYFKKHPSHHWNGCISHTAPFHGRLLKYK